MHLLGTVPVSAVHLSVGWGRAERKPMLVFVLVRVLLLPLL